MATLFISCTCLYFCFFLAVFFKTPLSRVREKLSRQISQSQFHVLEIALSRRSKLRTYFNSLPGFSFFYQLRMLLRPNLLEEAFVS